MSLVMQHVTLSGDRHYGCRRPPQALGHTLTAISTVVLPAVFENVLDASVQEHLLDSHRQSSAAPEATSPEIMLTALRLNDETERALCTANHEDASRDRGWP
ncbi:hypothetical protein [Paludisphaera soli]|uniref:hypothetical protein n=1 Tax=Paludisphaera soli TaxID=2712865 RepID=UPI0013EDF44E|nr:hypothetical protein [Paludisphaera soli]